MEKIDEAGAGFRSLTEHFDTTTPAGRMMMQMVGAFAEFERAMVRERTSAGLAAARAEGRIGGRRKKLDDTKRREIAEAVMSGRKTAAQMARMFGLSPPTVSRIVAAHVVPNVACVGGSTIFEPRPIQHAMTAGAAGGPRRRRRGAVRI